MNNLDDVLDSLRAPYMPAAVKWKLQTAPKNYDGRWSKGLAVAHIDARLVAERLNEVVAGGWESCFGAYGQGAVTCRLTVLGVTREDVGFSDQHGEMGVKSAYSDALKRAAVHFGIGSSLYATPKQYLSVQQLDQWQGKFKIGNSALQMLVNGYAAWLDTEHVVKRFGKPIDHGDLIDAPEPALDPLPPGAGQAGGERDTPAGHDLGGDIHHAFTTGGRSIQDLQALIDRLGAPPLLDVGTRIDRLTRDEAEVLLSWLLGKTHPETLIAVDSDPQGPTHNAIEGE